MILYMPAILGSFQALAAPLAAMTAMATGLGPMSPGQPGPVPGGDGAVKWYRTGRGIVMVYSNGLYYQ